MKKLTTLISIILIFLISALAQDSLKTTRKKIKLDSKQAIYLPKLEKVKLITLGYDSLASHLIWFNTLNYFGKEYLSSKDYRYLENMCELVSELNPKAEEVYSFCATTLSFEAKKPKTSLKMLTKATLNFPESWFFWYQKGFIEWYFLKNFKKAALSLSHASKLPNAPVFLASLSSKLLVEAEGTKAATIFLEEMLKRTKDKNARSTIVERIKQAYLKEDIEFLTLAVEQYKLKFSDHPKNIHQLLSEGFIQKIPKEPFGGNYMIDKEGKIFTTSNKKTLRFSGKTVDNGIVSREY